MTDWMWETYIALRLKASHRTAVEVETRGNAVFVKLSETINVSYQPRPLEKRVRIPIMQLQFGASFLKFVTDEMVRDFEGRAQPLRDQAIADMWRLHGHIIPRIQNPSALIKLTIVP